MRHVKTISQARDARPAPASVDIGAILNVVIPLLQGLLGGTEKTIRKGPTEPSV
jgi:hypothetical protein